MNYAVTGKVVRGDMYGRRIGFPTVNLDKTIKDIIPGVYSGKGIINNKTYRAAIIINEAGRIDAYLFGFRGDAYGKLVTLKPKEFIRKFEKFKTEEELITQIRKDIKM